MFGLLIASGFTARLRGARSPCLAVAGMAIFLAFISGLLAAFVERRLQERYRICRYVYCLTCICCLDTTEIRRLFTEQQQQQQTMCEMVESSSSPDTNCQVLVPECAPA